MEKMNKDIEIRSYNSDLTTDAESRLIEGYSIIFNSESVDLGGFREIIHKEAVTEALLLKSDILAKFDHNKVVARSKYGQGSLTLTIDERGLKYSFYCPEYADYLLESIKRGDLNQSSFAFSVNPKDKDAVKWEKRSDGTIIKHIYKIERLYDVSPVYTPAYENTDCSIRSYNEFLSYSKDIEDKLNHIQERINNLCTIYN